jgi:uracil-DNA glycosylase
MDAQLFCDPRRALKSRGAQPRCTTSISRMSDSKAFGRLVAEIRTCTVCAPHLPLGPRPIIRGRPSARLLIISQAPGRRVHDTGLSFNDRSGDRLRAWLALDRETFYDESRVAILGMAFCYPGSNSRGGDLPPRPECAPRWHQRLRPFFPAVELTLLVGRYAIDYYLPGFRTRSMTEVIAHWRDFLPEFFVLPHPSWRTTRWLRDNPWFENQTLPELRTRVARVLSAPPILEPSGKT